MIVVDASFALKLVLDEEDSDAAQVLWEDWVVHDEAIAAPLLFRAETLSGVRRREYRGLLTREGAEAAYAILDGLPVDLLEPRELYRLAREFAERFNRPAIYDCCYLALAAGAGCAFWTADRRLAHAVGGQLPWVNLLGAAS